MSLSAGDGRLGRCSADHPTADAASFAVNTAVIVLLQLVVLRAIDGRRRTRVLGLLAVVWAVAWLVLGLAGTVPGTTSAGVLVGHDMPVTYVATLLAGSAGPRELSLRMERVLPPGGERAARGRGRPGCGRGAHRRSASSRCLVVSRAATGWVDRAASRFSSAQRRRVETWRASAAATYRPRRTGPGVRPAPLGR
jgi:hypothetical protein